MLNKIASLLICISFSAALTLQAEPTTPRHHSSRKTKKGPIINIVPVAPEKAGWSLSNGVWIHSDGYKFVKGQVIRTGTQTHKLPPKPPTQAEMDAATKKKTRPLTPAEIAAAKATERERNLTPRAAPQTGTHL